MSMFCYQCEQTLKGAGCVKVGVCGKDEKTAAMQDLLLHATIGMAQFGHRLRRLGEKDRQADGAMIEALFTTVTNVNFDSKRIEPLIKEMLQLRDRLKERYLDRCKKQNIQSEELTGPAALDLQCDSSTWPAEAEKISITERKKKLGEDLVGLQELLTYGLKGMAAYADHARILGREDVEVYDFFYQGLSYLAEENPTAEKLLELSLRSGEINLKVMGMLNTAHIDTYGIPEPTEVRITPVKGKAILVSGHDLKDLEELLKQTEGQGINIYTHGEMLPAHAYPGLKKYKHLVGNYGGAWQDQAKEFDAFPGAILMTTNCIQRPRTSYKNRIFTSGLVAWPEVVHVKNRDFSPVTKAALSAAGFAEDAKESKSITVGFGHHAVLNVADKVVSAVKAGQIKHFFLVGGCDGAMPGRNYYTEFAQAVPKDCVILTLACGKYRFNKLEFGDIGGIPRLLDVGQCNDAYSAIQIAVALADAFKTDVNSLPLSLVLSWYEQKAVVILLTLLHLGIKNIRLGPSLPAFVTPAALNILIDKFGLKPIKTPEEDLRDILGQAA